MLLNRCMLSAWKSHCCEALEVDISTNHTGHNQTHFHHTRKFSIVASLVAAVLFGATTPASKILLGADISPWLLASLLYLGSGVGLALLAVLSSVWAVVRKRSFSLELPLGREWFWLLGASLFGGLLAPVLLMFGLAEAPAGNAALFLNLEGVFTVALAWFLFRESVDRHIAIGMGCIVAGGVLLSFKGDWESRALLPVLLLAGACLSWAIDNNLSRKLSGRSPLFSVIFKSLTAGGTNLVLALWQAQPGSISPSSAWIGASVTGFFGYGVSLLLFMYSLRHMGTARTSAYFSMAPFVGALGALLVLQEPVGPWFFVAAALMGTGVFMHISEHHDHVHLHHEEEHNHLHSHDEHHQHSHEHSGDESAVGTHAHSHRHHSIRHSHAHFPDEHHLHGHNG